MKMNVKQLKSLVRETILAEAGDDVPDDRPLNKSEIEAARQRGQKKLGVHNIDVENGKMFASAFAQLIDQCSDSFDVSQFLDPDALFYPWRYEDINQATEAAALHALKRLYNDGELLKVLRRVIAKTLRAGMR